MARELERAIGTAGAVGDESLLVLWSQPSKGGLAEIVALDGAARLVVIEILPDVSTREALGQVLEYLWNYSAITLSDLSEDYGQRSNGSLTLEQAFAARFGAPLTSIEERPRVILVGPAFSAHTTVGVRYVKERLGLDVRLLVASRVVDGSFDVTEYALPALAHTQKLQVGQCGIGRGRLFCVLQAGNPAALWHIGRESGGAITLLGRRALAAGAVRLEARILAPVERPSTVDLTGSGTFWTDKTDTERGAWLVGAVTTPAPAAAGHVIAAWWRNGALDGFHAHPRREFERRWAQGAPPFAPDWRRIAG